MLLDDLKILWDLKIILIEMNIINYIQDIYIYIWDNSK